MALPIMTIDDLLKEHRFREISGHLMYFSATCITGSISEAAAKLGKTPKSVSSHIDWIERVIGRRLVQDGGVPGRTKQLTKFGKRFWEDIKYDFPRIVEMLDVMMKGRIPVNKFVAVVNEPFVPLREE